MNRDTRGLRSAGRKAAIVLGLIGAVGLIAAGCGGDDDDSDAAQADATTTEATTTEEVVDLSAEVREDRPATTLDVLLPFQDSIVWAGYETARGPEGIYEDTYNLTTETSATDGSGQIQQLVGGKRDFAVVTTPELIIANARGEELIGIASLFSDVFTIAATPESGITSLEQLDGEVIGVTDLGGGELPLVRAALNSVGLEAEVDVELNVIGAGGAAAKKAIENGDVAAYAGAINDFVPLEDAGLTFEAIVGDEFTALPTNHMAVVPELLDDAEAFQAVKDLQKGWFEGNIYGEQFPTEALARICVVVPEDCQDEAFATAFYDSAQAIAIDEAKEGGCPDYDKLETVRTAIALVDAPEAADVDLMQVFPDDICQEFIPDQAVVDAQAERTAAAGG